MLASLAQQLRERRAGVGGAGGGSEDDGGGGEGGGQPIYLDDNCEVRTLPRPVILFICSPFLPPPLPALNPGFLLLKNITNRLCKPG